MKWMSFDPRIQSCMFGELVWKSLHESDEVDEF